MPDRPVAVRGGSGGIEAHCDDLVEAARLFGRAADDTADQCVGLHGYLFDPGLYTSGVLDPGGVAEFESELLGALDGSHGLSWLAAECAAIDLALRAAASAYLAADHIDEIGRTWLGPALALPAAVAGGLSTLRATHNPATALSSVIDDDPGLADVAVDIAGGPTGPAARGLADAMPDGHPIVRDVGVDDDPIATRPPRGLADVMSALEVRDQGADGEIDVRFLERPDGRRSVIVDIPGTKSWDPIPNGDVTSVGTDVRATAGSATSYERGVLQAMQRAGVRADDDVMLVGHSEGGIVAVNAATRACEQARFRVSHVVTAGAPIGVVAADVPRSVQVLAIENKHDVVPHLDGAPNPDRVNITTVTVDRPHRQVLDNHDIEKSYVPGAADVDSSQATSVRDFMSSASGFFDATSVTIRRYVITRGF